LDIDQSLLDELNRKIERERLSENVSTKKCSMLEMNFPDKSFDIIWAEGSISAIGFEKGLKEWRRLLKPGGFLVVHDVIDDVEDRIRKIASSGYKLLSQFSLPEDAHWTEFYGPLEIRIKELRAKYKSNPQPSERESRETQVGVLHNAETVKAKMNRSRMTRDLLRSY
jgi:ubiquinone/menaquinone biosynthesis C-methylase UbiE